MSGSPSPAFGLRRVGEFWRVVLAVWIVSVAVFVPARIVVWAAVGPTSIVLPGGGLPDGERALIAIELLRPVWAPLVAAVLSAWIALWAWTVLWHAGVVRWLLLSGRVELRLAEVVGHGIIGWWRWARLGLTSASVLILTHTALWLIVAEARDQAAATGDDGLLGFIVPAAVVVSICGVVWCWLATLRGAWLLGAADRRSAVLAWLAGFRGTARQPISSLFTLAVWGLPAVSAMVIPVVSGWRFEVLRGVFPTVVIEAAAGLLTAFCFVGLFLSFAPVTGMFDEPDRGGT